MKFAWIRDLLRAEFPVLSIPGTDCALVRALECAAAAPGVDGAATPHQLS